MQAKIGQLDGTSLKPAIGIFYLRRDQSNATKSPLRRLLALTFPPGEMVLFIPWRGGAAAERRGEFLFSGLLVGDSRRRWSSGGRAIRSHGVDPLRRRRDRPGLGGGSATATAHSA